MPPNLKPLPGRRRTIDLLPNEKEIRYEKILDFLNRYRNALIALALVLTLGTLGWFYWRFQENQTLQEAEKKLAAAATTENYKAVAHEYPGTDAAWVALMMEGDLDFQQFQFDKAEVAYRAVLDQYPQSALAPSAEMGLAAILETQGKIPEAIRSYQKVWADYPHAFQAAQSRFAAARLLEESGKFQEARRGFEDLTVFCPQSAWKNEAASRAKKITAQLGLAGKGPPS